MTTPTSATSAATLARIRSGVPTKVSTPWVAHSAGVAQTYATAGAASANTTDMRFSFSSYDWTCLIMSARPHRRSSR